MIFPSVAWPAPRRPIRHSRFSASALHRPGREVALHGGAGPRWPFGRTRKTGQLRTTTDHRLRRATRCDDRARATLAQAEQSRYFPFHPRAVPDSAKRLGTIRREHDGKCLVVREPCGLVLQPARRTYRRFLVLEAFVPSAGRSVNFRSLSRSKTMRRKLA